MRVAIAHDYLTQRGGAERVVLALTRAFPDAPVHTTLYEPTTTYPEFGEVDVRTSWLNRVPLLRREHRAALPLLPLASSTMRVDADVVVASSSGWAHGFRTTGKTLVYCYAPARWIYEPDRYLGADPHRAVAASLRLLAPGLRRWDQRQASRAERYLAISTVTQERIRRIYGREAEVLPAPHAMSASDVADSDLTLPARYFLVVSRLLEYKNVRAIVQAFARRADHLVVVGRGPQKRELESLATSNVTFLEGLTDAEMTAVYRGCSAVVAASHEDFGLTPLEAAVHGKPSVVLRWGGFLDTVVEGETGLFFDRPEPDLIDAELDRVEATPWDAGRLHRQADQFSEGRFIDRIRAEVADLGPR